MHPQIADLIELQKVDSAIEAETRQIEAIPGALAGAEARLREHHQALESRRQGLEESRKRRRALEGEVELVRTRLSKYQDQLMQVKTNEAYKAMLHEIDAVKAEIAAKEEKILEDMLRSDELEAAIGAGEKEFQGEKARAEAEKAALERQAREAEERRRGLQEERARTAGRLGPELLTSYAKIAHMRGTAVVEARDELCLGCRVKLRPQVFQEVRLEAGLRQCDSCGRFLYFQEGGGEVPVPPPGAPASPDEPAP